ncbi:hypothetical protein KOR42_32230 [Thalassoglobus neptunius]|uniref:Uncharacterized protein n=1 Tax=Thalassoglobus neptunius TaxID=1938619 RepID=A0A5C5WMV1_9PLAN|nr:hypothetical protein [Thalassoglobus neptunius]TWT51940.1 hypothetical protein KOR42_32230 [Thalassoglobus neptunius]
MASRRLQKRIEAEAAEKLGKTAKKTATKAKRATRKKTTTRKRKAKAVERKKIFWGVFSGTLKEEGRFAYDRRDKAEEKLEALRNRSTKKLYFIQPIKASLSDSVSEAVEDEVVEEVEDEVVETTEDDVEMSDDDSDDDDEFEDDSDDDSDDDDD